MKDDSPFGLATPERNNYTSTFNRVCRDKFGAFPDTCPFSDTVAIDIKNSTYVGVDYPYGYNLSIPHNITAIYTSGTDANTTISNYFDIQWRRYSTTQDSNGNYDNGSYYSVSAFRNVQTIALNNATQAVEGLVVNSISGGIGFRNHTAPLGFQDGVMWDEDLLFVEPETVCIDTNLTLDFIIGLPEDSASSLLSDIWLTDRGGFANLDLALPVPDVSNTQKNADLFGRAYSAAWWNNVYTMQFFNVTDVTNLTAGSKPFSYLKSTVGKKFPLFTDQTSAMDPTSLTIAPNFGSYLAFSVDSLASDNFTASRRSTHSPKSNPFRITPDNFTIASKSSNAVIDINCSCS